MSNFVLIEARRRRAAGRGGKSFTVVRTTLYQVASEIAPTIIAALAAENAKVAANDPKLAAEFGINADIKTLNSMDDFNALVVDKAKQDALNKLTDAQRIALGFPPRPKTELVQDTEESTEDSQTETAEAEETAEVIA